MSQSVVDFYSGRCIFLTGGTGFIGKVLIEKLLRTCPDLERIYLLMRTSRDGKSPQQRLQELLHSRVFQFNANQLDVSKVSVVCGDLTSPNLGLSRQDHQVLIEKVSIVIHSAAIVQFTGPLKRFVQHNVIGTDNLMALASKIRNLKAVLYVSTAYSNCNLIEVEEKVYPLATSAQAMIENILDTDSELTPQHGDPSLCGRPNGYTLSKAIAESLIEEKYSQLPVVICRPSIVTHSHHDPIEGWCDSFNGLAGAFLLGALGIARTMNINCDFKADVIPVDFVANSLIVIAYHTAAKPEHRKPVVHITSGEKNPVTWGQLLDQIRVSARRSPSLKMVRPIANNPICSASPIARVQVFLIKLFSHFLFACLFDLLQFVTFQKPQLVKITRKMHRAFDVLEDFTNLEWCFQYKHYRAMFESLSAYEQRMFASDVAHIHWPKYTHTLYMGSRRYLLNEDDSTIERGKIRQRKIETFFLLLDLLWYSLVFALLFYFLFNRCYSLSIF